MKHQLLDKSIYRNFTRLYSLALTAVALLSVLGQLLVQQRLGNQVNDSWIINYAGRQRFQSQAIVKTVLILADHRQKTDTAAYLAELRQWLSSWTKYHYELKSGNLADLGVAVENSPRIRQMFGDIEPHFQAIRRSSKNIVLAMTGNFASRPFLKRETDILLQHEKPFLRQMDAIVSQYQAEAETQVNRLRRMEVFLLAVTLMVLLLEAWFVFRPAVHKLRQTILALIEAEYHARETTEQLKSLNQSLTETREELLAATRQKYNRQVEQQQLRTAYVIQGQEEERKRLARDLHDDLGQMLTALKLGIDNLSGQAEWTEKGLKSLDGLKALASQTIQEVRTVSFNLMPSVLDDFGIASALKLLSSQLTATTEARIMFKTNMDGERLAQETEIGLYRIAQESLNNAIKHAKAKTITLELWAKRRQTQLNISDDGVGFDYRNSQRRTPPDGISHGLHHISERARLINGEIRITSEIGKGTGIRVNVPLAG